MPSTFSPRHGVSSNFRHEAWKHRTDPATYERSLESRPLLKRRSYGFLPLVKTPVDVSQEVTLATPATLLPRPSGYERPMEWPRIPDNPRPPVPDSPRPVKSARMKGLLAPPITARADLAGWRRLDSPRSSVAPAQSVVALARSAVAPPSIREHVWGAPSAAAARSDLASQGQLGTGPLRPVPKLYTEMPFTVETFPLPRKMKLKRRMALLKARAIDQQAAEALCNSLEIVRTNGTSEPFYALAPNHSSLQNLVGAVNWLAVAVDALGAAGRRNPRGIALVQWAHPETRVAPTFAGVPFFDDRGGHVSADEALDRVRAAVGASRRARVHQLVLLGGRGTGSSLLRAVAAASGVGPDDLLYVSAAHDPLATRYLWQCVYQQRFGFTRVPSLRANLDDPHDRTEKHEVPLVVRMGDLRALFHTERGSSTTLTSPRDG